MRTRAICGLQAFSLPPHSDQQILLSPGSGSRRDYYPADRFSMQEHVELCGKNTDIITVFKHISVFPRRPNSSFFFFSYASCLVCAIYFLSDEGSKSELNLLEAPETARLHMAVGQLWLS